MGICCCSLAGTQTCGTCPNNGTITTGGNIITPTISPTNFEYYPQVYPSYTWPPYISKEDVRQIIKEELEKHKPVSELKPGQCVLTKTENLSFEEALTALKAGKLVTNSGWNAKNQYVFRMPGYPEGVPANEALSKAAGIPVGTPVIINPYYMIKNAQGSFSIWVPSNGDLASNKWKIVEASTVPKTSSSTVSDYHGPITSCTVCSKDVKNVTYTAK